LQIVLSTSLNKEQNKNTVTAIHVYFNTLNCHIDRNIQTRFKIRSWLFIQLQGSITNQNRSYKYMYPAKIGQSKFVWQYLGMGLETLQNWSCWEIT